MSSPHIIVVGTGIVGTSIAYHLASKNVRVTLIDQAPNPASGVTQQSFGWITVSPEAPDHYLALRQQAIADWHRLDEKLKGLLNVNWSGALRWWQDPIDTERMAGRLTKAGYPVQLVDQRQIRLLEPNLKDAPSLAVYAQHEGAVDARLTTDLLTRAIRQTGTVIRLDNPVRSLMTEGSRITGVVTATGKLQADRVVLATGIATNALCQSLGVNLPINVSPATLLTFSHSHPFVNRIVSSPLLEIRPTSSSLTLAVEEGVEEPTAADLQTLAQNSLEKIKYHWRDAESIKLQRIVVGQRAIPEDGLPIIGRVAQLDGLYIAVMHAGVTLASVVGRLASGELLNDEEDVLLCSYRPTRFRY